MTKTKKQIMDWEDKTGLMSDHWDFRNEHRTCPNCYKRQNVEKRKTCSHCGTLLR